jgi:hypothetical protein
VLTTNKTYRHVLEYAANHNIRWKQIFLDDATNIFLGNNDPLPKFDFLWLITNNWMSFLLKNTHLHPANLQYARERMELSTECASWVDHMIEEGVIVQTRVTSSSFFKPIIAYSHPCRSAIVLRNSAAHLPPPESAHTISIPCASSFSYSQLTPAFLASHQNNDHFIPTLFQSVGLMPMSAADVCAHYRDRESLIERKLEDECSICLEPTRNRVLLSCCMGSFCGDCILRQLMSRADANCPTCRSQLFLPNFLYVPHAITDPQPTLMTKQQQAVDFIRRHPRGQIIVYSSYDNTYYQIQPLLQQIGIPCERLGLPLNHFHNTLQRYQEGHTRVLFVNDADLVRGLNLQRTSHLIFFYASPFYDTQQTLMNATLRQGRTEPLTVVRLSSVFE